MKHLIGVLITLFGVIIVGYGLWWVGSDIKIMTYPNANNRIFNGAGIVVGAVIMAIGAGVLAIGKAVRRAGLKGKLL